MFKKLALFFLFLIRITCLKKCEEQLQDKTTQVAFLLDELKEAKEKIKVMSKSLDELNVEHQCLFAEYKYFLTKRTP